MSSLTVLPAFPTLNQVRVAFETSIKAIILFKCVYNIMVKHCPTGNVDLHKLEVLKKQKYAFSFVVTCLKAFHLHSVG